MERLVNIIFILLFFFLLLLFLYICIVVSEEMYFEGYYNITNIDFSNNVIKHLQERYSEGF